MDDMADGSVPMATEMGGDLDSTHASDLLAPCGRTQPVSAPSPLPSAEEVTIDVRWGGRSVPIEISPVDWRTLTVRELKLRLDHELDIPASRMKFAGILGKEGQQLREEELICDCQWSKKQWSFMLMGTARSSQLKEPEKEGPVEMWDGGIVVKNLIHEERLQAAIQATEFRIIHNPRPGKKLLVLDLDYTIFDCRSSAPIDRCKRPFTDELLAHVYPFYDLVVWSQTRWLWVEAKLTEMNLLGQAAFNFTFVLDRSSMFTVTSTDKEGNQRTHEVKALEVIWSKFRGMYGAQNTVHVDDVERNFAMNPQNGVKIRNYKVKSTDPSWRSDDKELEYLTAYLLSLAPMEDLTNVDHSGWRRQFKD